MNGCWFVLQIHPLLTVYGKSSWKDGKSWKIAITLKPDILINGLELVLCLVAQLCPTLCHPMNCSPPASSVHGIFQSRILEWVALPPGGLPHPGIEPTSAVAPALQADSLLLSHWRSPMYKTGSDILAFHKLSLSIPAERIFIDQSMTSPQTSWSCFFERVRRFCSIV